MEKSKSDTSFFHSCTRREGQHFLILAPSQVRTVPATYVQLHGDVVGNIFVKSLEHICTQLEIDPQLYWHPMELKEYRCHAPPLFCERD